MITPERIAETQSKLYKGKEVSGHEPPCDALYQLKCTCIYGVARELLSELKDSLSREKKKREEVSRFASKLTEWIEEQIA